MMYIYSTLSQEYLKTVIKLSDRPKREEYLRKNPEIMQVTPNDLERLTLFPEPVFWNFKLPDIIWILKNDRTNFSIH